MVFDFLLPLVMVVSISPISDALPTMKMDTTCGYQSCNKEKPGMINVHLIPHSHDDVGWIVTVDQYYYRQVQYILDTVVEELLKDPTKRFIYVEQAFFTRWYNEQDSEIKEKVKMLVNEGRLEFILGGWSMNDEAATHYTAIIDNHKHGFEFLRQTFGECARPKIGWQIDPFGHSREQASLFAQFGFDALFFGRLDYQDKEKREKTKTMEFVWEASPDNLGPKANLFTGVLPNGYNPPTDFCFDVTCYMFNTMIKDDKRLHDYNLDDMVNLLLADVYGQAEHYKTKHLIMTMGSDFNYVAAHMWYKQLDKLIKYVNARQSNGSNVNLLYSTPSCYAKQLNNDNITWPTKQDDFFPYADRPHTFWTGYFTSRPALKYYARVTNGYYQAVKQFASLTGASDRNNNKDRLNHLASVMGVLQHHDAVSGTSKQAVAFDYAQRLAEGVDVGMVVLQNSYDVIMPKVGNVAPEQVLCTRSNISICNITSNSNNFQVNLYNPLARAVKYSVRIPVNGLDHKVYGPDGATTVISDIFPVLDETRKLNSLASKYELVFDADIPAVGYKTYFVNSVSRSGKTAPKVLHLNAGSTITGKYVSVTFDKNGHMTSMINHQTNIRVPLQQNFLYYPAHAGTCDGESNSQPSGAYIFRPDGDAVNIRISHWEGVYQGSTVQEARQKFSSWVSQVVRVYKDKPYVEVEWTVGPIPYEDHIGKEVVTRYTIPGWGNNGVFYTDSNGREILKRKINYRPTWHLNQTEPVAGNYFPINALISTKNKREDLQFTVLTDRSQGGTSLNDGDVEIMLHRRLFYDDCKGVGEALNETAYGRGLVVRGRHYLLLEKTSNAAAQYRPIAQEVFNRPQVTFSQVDMSPKDYVTTYFTEFNFSIVLPANIHLLTMERIFGEPPVSSSSGNVSSYSCLVRLEHFYEVGEDEKLSKPVTLDMKSVFPGEITAIHELALGGNVAKSEVHRLQWKTETGKHSVKSDSLHFNAQLRRSGTLTLNPMEIITLQVDV